MLPLLGYELQTAGGQQGISMSVYNEAPEEKERVKTDSLDLLKTEMHLVDYYNKKLKSDLWYADFEGSFVADEDCTWEFGSLSAARPSSSSTASWSSTTPPSKDRERPSTDPRPWKRRVSSR